MSSVATPPVSPVSPVLASGVVAGVGSDRGAGVERVRKEKRTKGKCAAEGCTTVIESAWPGIAPRLFCKEHKHLPKCADRKCRVHEKTQLTEFKVPGFNDLAGLEPQWYCAKHRVPPPPVAIPRTDLAAYLFWAKDHFGQFAGGDCGDSVVEAALCWQAGTKMEGTCKLCKIKTRIHEEGGLERCPACHYLYGLAPSAGGGSWRIGIRMSKASLAAHVKTTKEPAEKLARFVAHCVILWGEVDEPTVGDAEVEVEQFGGDFLAHKQCKLSERGLALLKTMEGSTDWKAVLPSLRASHPTYRFRPFLIDPETHEDPITSCAADEASKIVLLTVEVDTVYN